MKIELKNGYIMVKEVVRKKDEDISKSGLIIPEETLEEEQVAQGTIVESNSTEYKKGDTVLFHKTMPVDVNLKLDGDKGLVTYFFVKKDDVICKIVE